MIFFAILGLMVLGDFAWWYAAHRRLPRRWMRVLAGCFAAAQLLGLASIFISRAEILQIEGLMPRWVFSMVLIWHLLLLLPWMLWQLGRGIVWGVRKWRQTPEVLVPRPEPGGEMSRRQFFGAAAAFTPPLLTLGGAALGETQLDEFRVRRLDVDVPDLPAPLEGLTIAHVTDVHVGRFTQGRVLEQIVEATNKLEADIVALTGDLINDSLRALPAALDMVRGMRARHMVVTCEGNHDLIDDPAVFYRESARGGLPLLRGESAHVTVRGQKVQVLGLPWTRRSGDPGAPMKALLAKRDPSAWPLLLAHHPHAWDLAANVPLTLAGHTHGGQLMLNEDTGFGPWMFRYWSGIYRRGANRLVVSNGTGNWFPVRFEAPAEILHLTLRRATADTAGTI